MRHELAILFLLFFFSTEMSAEQSFKPNLKYGKPSDEELKMTVYESDSTAIAVVLYNIGTSKYQYSNNKFSLITKHCTKIKILKPEGKRYADISIPYYSPQQRQEDREAIHDLEACAYNLENGKRTKTSIKSDFIIRERLDEQYMQFKFSIPAVREGTVIEYSYSQTSDYYLQIEDWVMQTEIPTMYSEYNILIPKMFIFNIEMQGREQMEVKEKDGSYNVEHAVGTGLGQSKQSLSIRAHQLTFIAHHLPALPDDEEFLWCSNDYKVNVSFELEGVMNGEEYKSYTKTWEDIDKLLLGDESPDFGKRLLSPNPFRQETIALQLRKQPIKNRIASLFHLLKQKVTWNGEYRFYSRDPEKAIANGTGSNADINFIFISMLRESGIQAWSVALRQRNMGRLPFHYPSLQKLNTFIVCIRIDENENIYLDSSMDDAYLNILPQILTVEKARIINYDSNQEKWVDLTKIANNATKVDINATLTLENTMTGTQEIMYSGHPAVNYFHRYQQAKDSTEFINQRASQGNCLITSLKRVNDTINACVKESILFSKKIDSSNDKYLYINPMLFTHINKNPFLQAARIMPIDLAHIYTYSIACNLTLPEGYEIEELPKSQAFTTEKQGINCRYYIQKKENTISLRYLFTVKQLHFETSEYSNLQALWAATVEKNNALIVLKKL